MFTAKSKATQRKATFSEVVGRGLRGLPPTVLVFIPHYSVVVITATEEVAHVDVLLRLFLLRLLLRGSSGSTSGGTGSGSGGSSADVSEELGDVLTDEGLGEETGPVSFNGVAGGLDHLVELLLL